LSCFLLNKYVDVISEYVPFILFSSFPRILAFGSVRQIKLIYVSF